MTCIVGLMDQKKVWLGVDSIGSSVSTKICRTDRKLFKCMGVENALMAYTTSFRMGQILMYTDGFFDELSVIKNDIDHKYMVTKFVPKVQKAFEEGGFGSNKNGEKIAGNFLVAFRDQLYSIESDYQVAVNSIGYAADGCGMELALGSLHTTKKVKMPPRERVLAALRAASEFSVAVGPPFHIAHTGDCKIEMVKE